MKLSACSAGTVAWLASTLVAAIAVVAWGQGIRWQFGGLSTYRIFPLFGLLAFSLIWSMYVAGFFRRRLNISPEQLSGYYKTFRFLVVTAILLHPGLLWWQLWRDGFGLPPESYLQHYVAPALRWVVLLGSVSWLVFLAYDLGQRFKTRHWWKYLESAGDAAIAAVYYHGLRLGGNLQHGWFRVVWYFYGVVLLLVLADIYYRKYKKAVD